MIDDLDETIRQLLIEEMVIATGEIDIAFDQPKREWSARLSRPTINLFLYDIRENVQLRKFGWEEVEHQTSDDTVTRKLTPLRIDCHYMLTTWAAEPEDEHRLLTRAMLALFRYPQIPTQRLVGRLQNQAYDIRTRLAAHDKLTNPAEIWSAMDNELRPTVSYLVTLTMDPWTDVTEPVVRTFQFGLGPMASAETENGETTPSSPTPVDNRMTIAGVIRRQADKAPVPRARVTIKELGAYALTRENGRYQIKAIPPGQYTLEVRLLSGKTTRKTITVPAPDGNYNLEVSEP